MPAAKEKIGFQLVARLMALLFLLVATAASAQARGAAENRVSKKSAPIAESVHSQPLQLFELHRVKAPVRWYDASGYTFAGKGAAAHVAADGSVTFFDGPTVNPVLGGADYATWTVQDYLVCTGPDNQSHVNYLISWSVDQKGQFSAIGGPIDNFGQYKNSPTLPGPYKDPHDKNPTTFPNPVKPPPP